MIAMIGSIIVLASVAIGFLMAGGNLLLWHPSEIVVIIGAAFGPRQMQNGAQILRAVFHCGTGWIRSWSGPDRAVPRTG